MVWRDKTIIRGTEWKPHPKTTKYGKGELLDICCPLTLQLGQIQRNGHGATRVTAESHEKGQGASPLFPLLSLDMRHSLPPLDEVVHCSPNGAADLRPLTTSVCVSTSSQRGCECAVEPVNPIYWVPLEQRGNETGEAVNF
ncbi:hypothetical protein SKAU_G00372740 [Synaphobranchus kaupii]|uniref:Uncharacterized protein n=1 Tax=Synaphobranchus kaupii TaxID=118154 RepID=A0A9Q1IE04_SYNKA|nr:hypothetical protein SKAU_G00372740 [Synaphobranchus kaupii]